MVAIPRNFILFIVIVIVAFIMWSQLDFNMKTITQQWPLLSVPTSQKSAEISKDNGNGSLPRDVSTISTELKPNNPTTTKAVTQQKLKYILIWTTPNRDPLMYLKTGQEAFKQRHCAVQNCYVTTKKNFFKDVKEYDVILFNGPEAVDKNGITLPAERSPKQKYVFASIESSGYYPLCTDRYQNYFNVTWTYKLNSDIFYGYIIIRDEHGNIIGPKEEMQWMSIDEMKPINDTIKQKLSTKTKAAAWLVSNCGAPSGRDRFIKTVQRHLKKHGMTVDIYGDCGTIRCARRDMPRCLQIFEKDYYFYFSFENSFSEDYVTEKVLHGLQHYTLPVIFGTANYTRFMPDGIYLNAKELGEEALANKMIEIINDKEKYYSYFKYLNHYSYHYVEEVPETDFYCKFCEKMNDEEFMQRTTYVEEFQKWWNAKTGIRSGVCGPGESVWG